MGFSPKIAWVGFQKRMGRVSKQNEWLWPDDTRNRKSCQDLFGRSNGLHARSSKTDFFIPVYVATAMVGESTSIDLSTAPRNLKRLMLLCVGVRHSLASLCAKMSTGRGTVRIQALMPRASFIVCHQKKSHSIHL